jgi:signal transduction histidine kinase
MTLTVCTLEEDFFVEDDGIGVAPKRREEVFEAGETSVEANIWLGLEIVRTIRDAHGCEVSLVKGRTGGTRSR